MQKNHGQIELCGLEVRCVIGDLPEERVCEQRLVVEAVLTIDLLDVLSSDALHDTVDYVALGEAIRAALIAGQFRMIESAAACAAQVCLRQTRVEAVRVRVEKAGVIPGLRAAAVTLERKKGET